MNRTVGAFQNVTALLVGGDDVTGIRLNKEVMPSARPGNLGNGEVLTEWEEEHHAMR